MKCSIEFRDLFMTAPLVIRCNQNAFYAHLLCIQCFHRKSAATTLLMEVYINLHWLPGTGSQSAKIIWDWCWMCVQKKKPNIYSYLQMVFYTNIWCTRKRRWTRKRKVILWFMIHISWLDSSHIYPLP